jgi:signal transduction histidine kinase
VKSAPISPPTAPEQRNGDAFGAERVLRVPLVVKLLGANALIVLVALAATYAGHTTGLSSDRAMLIVAGAIVAGMVANLILVNLALRPIRDLEHTAWRIWHGDPRARVPRSPVGDPELDKVGGTLNALLDHLEQDRARLHTLATEVIRAEDRERARIGRELHDSIAQGIAALTYQLAAAETDARDAGAAARIRAIRVLAGQVLDEVELLSHTVHPRVLNDLGLLAGLRHLARTTTTPTTAVEVLVTEGTDDAFRGIGMETAAALYRVAQEALQNAIRHANAQRIEIIIGASEDQLTLRVVDDGTGFDVVEAKARRPGMGLFTMSERVGLVRGTFTVETEPGKGTTVRATIPVERESFRKAEVA